MKDTVEISVRYFRSINKIDLIIMLNIIYDNRIKNSFEQGRLGYFDKQEKLN